MNTDITKQMEMVLYRTEDDNVTVSALIKDETIWLTQKAMAELFGIDKSGISRHLAKIFESGELDEEVVVAKIATTTFSSGSPCLFFLLIGKGHLSRSEDFVFTGIVFSFCCC